MPIQWPTVAVHADLNSNGNDDLGETIRYIDHLPGWFYAYFTLADDGPSVMPDATPGNGRPSDAITITVTATLAGSVIGTELRHATAVNVPHGFKAAPVVSIVEGVDTTIRVTAKVYDAGQRDKHRLEVTWGDGTITTGNWHNASATEVVVDRIVPQGNPIPNLYNATFQLLDDDADSVDFLMHSLDVRLNDDDDDLNYQLDRLDDPGPGVGVSAEDDLVLLALTNLMPNATGTQPGTLVLGYDISTIKIWDSADKQNLILPHGWGSTYLSTGSVSSAIHYSGQSTVWVEGVGINPDATTIKLSWADNDWLQTNTFSVFDEGSYENEKVVHGGSVLVTVWNSPIPKLWVVDFMHENEITKDPILDQLEFKYATNHWKDDNLDGDVVDVGDRQWPASYAGLETMKVGMAIMLSEAWSGGALFVRAFGTENFDISPVEAALDATKKQVSIEDKAASKAFPKKAYHFDNFVLAWEISFDNQVTWKKIGSSSNDIYITLKEPAVSPLFHTVVHIGSHEAHNETTENGVITEVWKKFESLNVDTVAGNDLHYYLNYNSQAESTKPLLATGDGQCGAWSQFFVDVIKSQGIVRNNNWVELKASKNNAKGFIVKNWTFDAGGGKASAAIVPSLPQDAGIVNAVIADYPYINVIHSDPSLTGAAPWLNPTNDAYAWAYQDVNDELGIEGQSTANPASFFVVHVLLQYDIGNGYEWFDPSYGVKYAGATQADLELAFDDVAIDGYFRGAGVTVMVKENKINVDLNGDAVKNATVEISVVFIRKNIIDTNEIKGEVGTK